MAPSPAPRPSPNTLTAIVKASAKLARRPHASLAFSAERHCALMNPSSSARARNVPPAETKAATSPASEADPADLHSAVVKKPAAVINATKAKGLMSGSGLVSWQAATFAVTILTQCTSTVSIPEAAPKTSPFLTQGGIGALNL